MNPVIDALAAQGASTNLQGAILALHRLLGDVRQLDERERRAFGDVCQRSLVRALGGDLIVDEAERITKAAS
jgi:hypothetical protein